MNVFSLLFKEQPEMALFNHLPKFNITNVADYYFNEEKEYYNTHEDFPYPRPPFDKLWFEYEIPHRFMLRAFDRIHQDSQDRKEHFENEIANLKFYFSGIANTYTENGKTVFGIVGSLVAFFSHGPSKGKPAIIEKRCILTYQIENGKIVEPFHFEVPSPQNPKNAIYFFHPVLLAFSFSSCRNIEIIRVEAPVKLNRTRERKGKAPIPNYHVINILPFGKVFQKTTRKLELAEDGKLDVVIRRGSFARYGPSFNRGLLFGKYEGIFWRPAINLVPTGQEYLVKGPSK